MRGVRVLDNWAESMESVDVAWLPVPGVPAAPVTAYLLQLEGGGLAELLTVSVDSVGSPAAPLLRLSGLSPLAAYRLSIAAASEGGAGPFSAPAGFRIPASAGPPAAHLVSPTRPHSFYSSYYCAS